MATRLYGINQVQLSWQGLDFKEGLSMGSSIVEARTGPNYTMKAKANGDAIKVFNPDRTGTVSILVEQNSRLHQQLVALAQADDTGPDAGRTVGPMVMTNNATGAKSTYQNAYIATDPDETFAAETSSDFTWVFNFERIVRTPNPNDQNLVGS